MRLFMQMSTSTIRIYIMLAKPDMSAKNCKFKNLIDMLTILFCYLCKCRQNNFIYSFCNNIDPCFLFV